MSRGFLTWIALVLCATGLHAATVTNMSILESGPTFSVGDNITFNLTFDAGVTVTAGSSRLKLAVNRLTDDAYAVANSTSTSTGVATFSFTYVVQAGDYSDNLNYSGVSALTGVTGFNSGLPSLSTTGLKVSTPLLIRSVTATPSGGTFKSGDSISISVNLNRFVTPNLSSASIALATGTPPRSVSNLTVPTSRASSIALVYAIQPGDLSSDLDYVGIGSFTFSGSFGEALTTTTLLLPTPGATNSLSQTSNLIIDGVAPGLTITPPASPQRIAPVTFSVSASETVTGLVAGDFSTVNQISPISISGSGSSYTVAVTPVSGLTLNATTNAGATSVTTTSNPNVLAGQPLVIGGQSYVAAANSSGSGPYTITLTSGLTANNASGTSIFTDNSTSITLLTTNNAASDVAGNLSGSTSNSGPVLYDPVAPIASVSSDSPAVAGTASFTVRFSELVATALQNNTLTVTNGTVTSIDGSLNPVFTVLIARTQPMAATTLRVNANAVQDAAGNGNLVSATVTSTPPATGLTLNSVSATNGSYKLGSQIDVTVLLGLPVTVAGSGATLALNTGSTPRQATFVSATTGTTTTSLLFRYTVQDGDTATDLDYTSNPFSRGTLTFDGRSDLTIAFPAPAAPGSLAQTSAVVVDGVSPTFSLSALTTKNLSELSTLSLTTSEVVTGLDSTDLNATNTASTRTISGTSSPYTIAIAPTSQCQISAGAGTNTTNISLQSVSGAITLAAGSPVQIGAHTYQTSTAANVTTSSTPVTLTSGLLAGAGVGDAVYTAPVIMNVSLAAGAAADNAGNASTALAAVPITYDPLSPTCTVTGSGMVGNAAVFLVAFNENVTQSTLAAGNLTVANGGTPTVIPINFRSFEVKIVPQSLSSPVELTVIAGAASDAAGNPSLISNKASVTPNAAPPILTINPTPAFSTTKPVNFVISSSEPVTGLSQDDFTISNGTFVRLIGTASPYTLEVEPRSDLYLGAAATVNANTVFLKIRNGSLTLKQGTPLRLDNQTIILDEDAQVDTNGIEVQIRQSLSAALPIDTQAWQASGLLISVTIRANAVVDEGNLGNTTAINAAKTYDFLPPAVIEWNVSGSTPTNRAYYLTFNENIVDLPQTALSLVGGQIDQIVPPVNQFPNRWMITVNPQGSATSRLSIAAGSVADLAGNTIAASGPYIFPNDTSNPDITLTGPASDTPTSPLNIQVAISKAVTGLTASKFVLSNAIATQLTTSGTGYQLSITPTPIVTLSTPALLGASAIRCIATTDTQLGAGGAIRVGAQVYRLADGSATVVTATETLLTLASSIAENQLLGAAVWPARGVRITASLPAGSCVDSDGRPNTASNEISLRYDPTPPVFGISSPAGLDTQGRFLFNLTPSETVATLDQSKLVVTQGTLASLTAPTGGSTVWVAAVTPTGSQTVTLAMQAGASVDNAGNTSVAAAAVTAAIVPQVTQVTARNADGTYGSGLRLRIQVRFSEIVNVVGAPTLQLALGNGKLATYSEGTGSADLLFDYVVTGGDNSSDLDYNSSTALALPANVTIRDVDGNAARLTLPNPGTPGSLGANANLVINTGSNNDPAKPNVDGQASSGCGAGSGIALALGVGWLGLSWIRRRRAA